MAGDNGIWDSTEALAEFCSELLQIKGHHSHSDFRTVAGVEHKDLALCRKSN